VGPHRPGDLLRQVRILEEREELDLEIDEIDESALPRTASSATASSA